jgi:transposase
MPEKSTELVEGLILKPGSNGRRTYSVAAKRALVELCNRPGISVAGMALAHGINANLLRRWMVQYSPTPSVSAVTVRLSPSGEPRGLTG